MEISAFGYLKGNVKGIVFAMLRSSWEQGRGKPVFVRKAACATISVPGFWLGSTDLASQEIN